MLFANTPKHDHDAVAGYAKALGLDPNKSEAAYQAANQTVSDDEKEGEALGVDATPTTSSTIASTTVRLASEFSRPGSKKSWR